MSLLPWLVLILGLGSTFVLWQSARLDAAQALDAEFQLWVDKIAYSIEHRLKSHVQVLRGVVGLFEASEIVDRQEFRCYVEALRLQDNYPGIQGIGFAAFIPPDRKAEHEAAVRREGFPDYAIRPAGAREFYTAVLYLEPFSGRNLRAFGYDMGPEPVRWAAAARARDQGEVTLSGLVTLLQETATDPQPGFLLFVPIYRNGLPHDTVETRRTHLLGWAYSPLRMHDLMHSVLETLEFNKLRAFLNVAVHDGDHRSPESLLFALDPTTVAAPGPAFHTVRRLEFGGHPWSVQVTSTPGFESRSRSKEAALIAFAGSAGSLLLALLIAVLVTSQMRVAVALRETAQVNEQLRERERELLWAQRTAQLGSWSYDPATRQPTWSEGMFRVWGLDPGRGAPAYDRHRNLIHPEDWPRFDAAVQAAIAHGKPYRLDLRIRRPDGEERSIITICTPHFDHQGKVVKLSGTNQDITERKRVETALHFTQSVVDRMSDAAYWAAADGRLMYANAAACRMLGYAPDELLALSIKDIVPNYTDARWAIHWSELRRAGSLRLESQYRKKNGETIPVEIHGDYIEFAGIAYACGLARDITDRKRLQEVLREQAIRDPLTGLFNRRYLDETLPRELGRCQRIGEPLTVAMLDLDHFKRFNDDYGHEAGDAVLRTVGDLLRQSLRVGDIACRYGGEELVLILPGAMLAAARARLEHVRQAAMRLRLPYRGSQLPAITVSIGLAAAEPDEADAAALLGRADAALYRAKEQGRNRVIAASDAPS